MSFTKNADGVMVPTSLAGTGDFTAGDRAPATIDWNVFSGLEGINPRGIVARYKAPNEDMLVKQLGEEMVKEFTSNPINTMTGLNGDNKINRVWNPASKDANQFNGFVYQPSIMGDIVNRQKAKQQIQNFLTPGKIKTTGAIRALPGGNAADIAFKDTNQQGALEALANAVWEGTRTPEQLALYEKNADRRQAAWDKLDEEQYAKVLRNQKKIRYDAMLSSKRTPEFYADVATKLGMTPDKVASIYDQYSHALNTIYDPVGANWQDLKTLPIYDEFLKQVKKASPVDSGTAIKLESAIPNADLPWQYYAWNTANNPEGIYSDLGNRGDMLGYNTQANVGWADFLPNGKAWQNASEQEITDAKASFKQFVKNSWGKKSQFDLRTAVGHSPGKYWFPDETEQSNPLRRFDIAQNFLGKESGGTKSYKDVGLDINKAYQSGWFEDKPDGGFLGGMGGFLGGALSLGSLFVPGAAGVALGLAGKGLGMASAIDSGNVGSFVGNLINLPGGVDAAGNLTSIGSKLTNSLGSTMGNVAGIPGNVIASSGLNAGLGALSGGATGAITGAAGPLIGYGTKGLTGNANMDKLLGTAANAGLGYALRGNQGVSQVGSSIPAGGNMSGTTKDVNGVKFKYVNGVWVHA